MNHRISLKNNKKNRIRNFQKTLISNQSRIKKDLLMISKHLINKIMKAFAKLAKLKPRDKKWKKVISLILKILKDINFLPSIKKLNNKMITHLKASINMMLN